MVNSVLAKVIGCVIISLGSMIFALYAYQLNELFGLWSLIVSAAISIVVAISLMEGVGYYV